MADYRFERQCRTAYSEQFVIRENDQRVGRVDLHYGPSVVYATLAVEEKFTEVEIMELMNVIDDDLVSSTDMPRDDFVVAVFQGREVGLFSDDYFEGEEEDDDEEDEPRR